MKARLLNGLISAAVLAAWAPTALGQAYPAKSIRIVLPFAAGSAVDALARFYGQKMSETWKQQVVIDNRTGASGIIGTEIAARSPPTATRSTWATSRRWRSTPPFTRSCRSTWWRLRADHAGRGDQQLPDRARLTAGEEREGTRTFAKARPGQLNYASGGVGSAQHIPMEMLKSMTGIDIVHVAYKGLTPAFNDVVAGQMPMMVPGVVTALPFTRQGGYGSSPPRRPGALLLRPTSQRSPNRACPASIGIRGPGSSPPRARRRRRSRGSTPRPCASRGSRNEGEAAGLRMDRRHAAGIREPYQGQHSHHCEGSQAGEHQGGMK